MGKKVSTILCNFCILCIWKYVFDYLFYKTPDHIKYDYWFDPFKQQYSQLNKAFKSLLNIKYMFEYVTASPPTEGLP